MVERRGGRYLARTSQVEQIEGERVPAQIQMIIAWPSKAAADECYASDEYLPYREARRAGASNEVDADRRARASTGSRRSSTS